MPYSWNKKGNQAKPPGGRPGGKMGKPPAIGRPGGKMGKAPRPSDLDRIQSWKGGPDTASGMAKSDVMAQIKALTDVVKDLSGALSGGKVSRLEQQADQIALDEQIIEQLGGRPSDADMAQLRKAAQFGARGVGGRPSDADTMARRGPQMPSPGMMNPAVQAQRQALAAEMAVRQTGSRPSDADVRQGFMPPEPPQLPQGAEITPGAIPPPMPTPESARAERMRRITAMARDRIGMKPR